MLWLKNWERKGFIKLSVFSYQLSDKILKAESRKPTTFMMHKPVLLKELIYYLDPKSGDIILDGTAGGGGHSMAICEAVGERGRVISLDQDKTMIDALKPQISKSKCQIDLVNENFRNLDKALNFLKIKKLDGVIFDFGLNSQQLDSSGRGFTFQKDEPLLMTFKSKSDSSDLTAREIVNSYDEKEIADIIYEYGEERYSRQIAKKIVEKRKESSIMTTFELVDVIRSAVPAGYRNNRRTNCCTKTFQALRITANDEIEALRDGVSKAWEAVKPGGRIVVISFHSLEDRIIKNFFRDKKKEGVGKVLTKKPITPSDEEKKLNPRARSAKLRAIKKTEK